MSALVGGAGGAVLGAAIIGGGASIAGSMISSNGAQNAAQTQAQAASQAAQLQYQEYQQQQQAQAPWIAAGAQALPQLSSMAAQAPTFTAQDFANNMDPAYQFDLQQGQQAIQRSAAASGGLASGGTLKSLSDYSQGQASNEYQNAYNRFMDSQNTQFNRLASVAGIGQTANNTLGAAGQNMANNVGNEMTGAANAIGASQIASANAYGNSLSSIGNGAVNAYTQSTLMNRLFPQGAGYGGSATGLGTSLGQVSAPVDLMPQTSSASPYSLLANN